MIGSRLTTLALEPAGRLLLTLWKHPRLAEAVAAAAGLGIAYEAAVRSAVCRLGQRPDRPVVHWHEGGSGPPLLLVNGFTGSGLTWPTSWVRRLEQRFRVIRVDNRGTGWSQAAPAPFTMADMADDVADVLTACGIDRCVVLGMSMGGMIAQELAVRHPERVERLVLVCTIPPVPATVATAHGMGLARAILGHAGEAVDTADPDHEQVADSARTWRLFTADAYEPRDGAMEEMGRQILVRPTPRQNVIMQARAINAWHGPQRLRRITTPTVVVHGAADRVVPIENARRIAALVPGAELVELPDVGHLVPWEAEDALVHILTGVPPAEASHA